MTKFNSPLFASGLIAVLLIVGTSTAWALQMSNRSSGSLSYSNSSSATSSSSSQSSIFSSVQTSQINSGLDSGTIFVGKIDQERIELDLNIRSKLVTGKYRNLKKNEEWNLQGTLDNKSFLFQILDINNSQVVGEFVGSSIFYNQELLSGLSGQYKNLQTNETKDFFVNSSKVNTVDSQGGELIARELQILLQAGTGTVLVDNSTGEQFTIPVSLEPELVKMQLQIGDKIRLWASYQKHFAASLTNDRYQISKIDKIEQA